MDHRAAADAGTEVGGTLHRIPESAIRELAQDAGLRLRAESDMFANPDDPLDISVFHESIRRYTNRFVLLFEK